MFAFFSSRRALVSASVGAGALLAILAMSAAFAWSGHSSPSAAHDASAPPVSEYWLIVTFAHQGPVAMPLGSPSDYLGQEVAGAETLFKTRLPDGTIQTYHATEPVVRAFVGSTSDRDEAARDYEANRAGSSA